MHDDALGVGIRVTQDLSEHQGFSDSGSLREQQTGRCRKSHRRSGWTWFAMQIQAEGMH
jgi:hypothetical protein